MKKPFIVCKIKVQRISLKTLKKTEQADPDGRSCLHLACCSGNLPGVECLLTHGANANAFDKHRLATPLFCAVVSVTPSHVSCVEALLNGGADINAGLHDLV